jgi:hypothetical protein
MVTVKVHDLMHRRALITRESAEAIKVAIASAFERNNEVALDFSEIDAITPSFVDELVGSIDEAIRGAHGRNARLIFLNVPTRLSASSLPQVNGKSENPWQLTRARRSVAVH